MVESVTIVNKESGEQIEIGTGANYVLDSVDWDSPSVTMQSYRTPFQIGKTLSGVVVGTRKPTITGYIIADITKINSLGMTWEEYNKRQKQEIEQKKKELNKLISVYQDVTIKAGEYNLDARPTGFVKYSTDMKENNEILCLFSIEFECFNPMFYKQSKTVVLATTENKFTFPMVLTSDTKDEYAVFGEIVKRQSMIAENDGDVDVGCTIVIMAKGGEVKNPKVYNVTTGEFLEIDGTKINDGESFIITTEAGEENVIYRYKSSSDGSIKELTRISFLKTGSEFFKIRRGSAYYGYSVNSEYANNVDMSLTYTERYANIEEM